MAFPSNAPLITDQLPDTCIVIKRGFIIELAMERKRVAMKYPLDQFFFDSIPDVGKEVDWEYLLNNGLLVQRNYFFTKEQDRTFASQNEGYRSFFLQEPMEEKTVNKHLRMKIYRVEIAYFTRELTLDSYCDETEDPGAYSFYRDFDQEQKVTVVYPEMIIPW